MPMFVYEGPGARLVVGGRTFTAGRPLELSGAAAEAAANHPRLRKHDPKASAKQTAPEPAWGSTIDSAIAYVGDDAAKAGEVLADEQSKGDKARKSLVEKLEPIANGGNS